LTKNQIGKNPKKSRLTKKSENSGLEKALVNSRLTKLIKTQIGKKNLRGGNELTILKPVSLGNYKITLVHKVGLTPASYPMTTV